MPKYKGSFAQKYGMELIELWEFFTPRVILRLPSKAHLRLMFYRIYDSDQSVDFFDTQAVYLSLTLVESTYYIGETVTKNYMSYINIKMFHEPIILK